MRQQINLYQPTISEERKPFSAVTVAAAFGAIVLGLGAFSVHARLGVEKLAAEVEALRAQQQAQEQMLEQLGQTQAAQEKPEQIELRIKALTASVSSRTRALKILQSGGAGQTTGFADRLEALARRHVDGLWIDTMMLSGTGGSMTLGGATLDAETVPAYLQSLAREPVLAGTRFEEFIIEHPKAQAAQDTDSQTDEGSAPAKRQGAGFIRFRAGNRALAADQGAST